ncbi:MAG: transposase [Myxococcales bacterium]|nr:transposase [Myxococcales bacterium]
MHAGVLIHAGDREGLERLCRYGARPPFSLERISLLADGRVLPGQGEGGRSKASRASSLPPSSLLIS